MYKLDIHSNKETVDQALYQLDVAIKLAKKEKDKILELVVGYGSSGGTHKIRTSVIEKLDEYKKKKKIKGYISGSDIDFGAKHIEFLKIAPEFYNLEKSANKGVIYVKC